MVYFLYFLFTILYCFFFVFQVCNLHCLSMHGDKSQSERSRVLESFLAGECPVLVCTALLGRGIDLPNVSQVSFQMIKFWSYHGLKCSPCCLSRVPLFF